MTTAPTPAAADLERDLTQLQERRATLTGQLKTAQEALRAAREGLVAGSVKVDAVETAQGRVNALSGAVNDLDGTIGALRLRLEAAQAEERRAAYLDDLFELARQATERVAEHHENKAALLEAAKPFLQKQAELYSVVVQLRRDFLALAEAEGDGLDRATLTALEARGADLTGVMTRWIGTGLTSFDRTENILHPMTVGPATSISIR